VLVSALYHDAPVALDRKMALAAPLF